MAKITFTLEDHKAGDEEGVKVGVSFGPDGSGVDTPTIKLGEAIMHLIDNYEAWQEARALAQAILAQADGLGKWPEGQRRPGAEN